MNKYFLHGRLTAKEDFGDQLTNILLDASKLVATAVGCVLYVVSKDSADANSVWITEVWDTQQDHNNSLNVPGVKELIAKAIPMLSGPPAKGQELIVLGGKGVE